MTLIWILFLFLTLHIFTFQRLLTYLHILQQEDYDAGRFLRWVTRNGAFDKRLSILVLAMIPLQHFLETKIAFLANIGAYIVPVSLTAVLFLVFMARDRKRLQKAKKALVLTDRAKRIFCVAFVLLIGLSVLLTGLDQTFIAALISIQAIPFMLALSVGLLSPYEAQINARFRREAVQKLEKIKPMVIAVTGSFGKTSVKHILAHIMGSVAPSLATPGSVNTEMGIARIIREQLQPQHQFFIVEMGAYGIGSIARLCRFTPPKLSIISAIGEAHYERFKTLEDTAKAKFEIAEAAIKEGGKTIIHDSVLERQYAQQFVEGNRSAFIVCGEDGDIRIRSVTQTKNGLEMSLIHNGETHWVTTPLFGLHHAANVALAFAAAVLAGVAPKDAVRALATTPQIRHRLEVKKTEAGWLIDDAYNSNPKGFHAALDLLDFLGREHKSRRILVTPGMVELGAKHDEEHTKLGEYAAKKADIVLAVLPSRIPSFVATLRKNMLPKQQLIEVPSFAAASQWLEKNHHKGDIVLLENDLPDIYENKLRI
ncbi:MAG: UDP-N-acetylmuramoyl-tripeptide--D-alanyl-D-alanine ligase [Alphaproteobacteria bacterium]|nr:UDP-N-acetylmuramoyl-tripeptide--D-alanyl-D-alanine ligase [Alphaproteobacteria bacterium]